MREDEVSRASRKLASSRVKSVEINHLKVVKEKMDLEMYNFQSKIKQNEEKSSILE